MIVHLGDQATPHGHGAVDLEVEMVGEYRFRVRTVSRKRWMTVTGSGRRGFICSAREYYDQRVPCIHIQAVMKYERGDF